jgi:hypothetical protein
MSVAVCLLLSSFSVAVCLLLSSFSVAVCLLLSSFVATAAGAVADSALPLSPLILSMYIDRNTKFSHRRNWLLALAKWNDRGPILACYLARPRA